jgi:hypothetical protein
MQRSHDPSRLPIDLGRTDWFVPVAGHPVVASTRWIAAVGRPGPGPPLWIGALILVAVAVARCLRGDRGAAFHHRVLAIAARRPSSSGSSRTIPNGTFST